MDDRKQHLHAAQDSLFPQWPAPEAPVPEDSPLVATPPLQATTTLAGVALPYRNMLLLGNHSMHTVDCFLSDLRLLSRYLGAETKLGIITREQITQWLMHLRWESTATPAPKTMARRVTFLKNFFGWLYAEGVLPEHLAASLAFARPLPPLPDLLFEDELRRLVEAARIEHRCHLLVLLALEGGLKKEEILALTPERIDLSDPNWQAAAAAVFGTGGLAGSKAA